MGTVEIWKSTKGIVTIWAFNSDKGVLLFNIYEKVNHSLVFQCQVFHLETAIRVAKAIAGENE